MSDLQPITDAPAVLLESRGAVSVLTLNRPERLNALSPSQIDETLDAVEAIGRDVTCRVLVIQGAGGNFCAGLDLAEGLDDPQSLQGMVQNRYRNFIRGAEILVRLRELPQPVIAALSGATVGGGLAVAAAADIRIAEDTATFRPSFTRLGFTGGDLGASWWLPRVVGLSNAAQMLYTAEKFDAARARELNFVSQVVAHGEAMTAALELAERIADNAPFAVRETKQLLNSAINLGDLRQHMASEARAQVLCSFTHDTDEGITALLERRDPHFRDR